MLRRLCRQPLLWVVLLGTAVFGAQQEKPPTPNEPVPAPTGKEQVKPAAATPAPATPASKTAETPGGASVPAPSSQPAPAPPSSAPEAPPAAAASAAKSEPFVPPSIEELLGQLRMLQPLPFDRVWKNPPAHPPQERARLALVMGRLIADGFLVVAAERANKAEPVGRSLLKMAESLGFGAKIRARGKAVIDEAKKEHWAKARLELVLTQADADAALRALNDEELVTLVALGGWLRGLEITTTTVVEEYTPQRAAMLWRPALAKSALVQLQSFRPATRDAPVVKTVREALEKIANVVSDNNKILEKGEVEKLQEIAKSVNAALNAE